MNILTFCFLSQCTNRQVRTNTYQHKTNEAIYRQVVHKGCGVGQRKPWQLQPDVTENAAVHSITEPLLTICVTKCFGKPKAALRYRTAARPKQLCLVMR